MERKDALSILNTVKSSSDTNEKLMLLNELLDLVIRSPPLLQELFPHIVEFDKDKSHHVRHLIVLIIEEVCSKYPDCILS